MKKILFIIVIVLITLIGVYYYINKDAFQTNQSLTTQEIKQLCLEQNCEISYQYNDQIESGELISTDSVNNIYIYSLGRKPVKEIEKTSYGVVGDVILYEPNIYPLDENNMYDFDAIFAPIKDKFSEYDVSMFVQESIAAGCIETYPTFCSPFEVSDYMFNDMSMDIVSMANNHQLDQGVTGVQSAIEYYEKNNYDFIGGFNSNDKNSNPLIREENGIKVGYLAYATTYNGFVIAKDFSNMITPYSKERLITDISYLQKQDVDAIISYIHWGNEYTYIPNDSQINIAQEMTQAGVDVIIGSHPHVLQPIEELTATDESKTLVAYSLGNFTAAQHTYVEETAYGGILEFTLEKTTEADKTTLIYKDVNFYPTYNSDYHNGLITYPLNESVQADKNKWVCDIVTNMNNMTCSN